MDQAPFSYPPPDRETAMRCGRKVFGWAATLQMLSFAMVAFGFFVITWQRTTYYTANQGGFWDWLIAKKDLRETVIAGLCAMIVFTVAALPMGRLAGRAILLRRRRYAWVGPLAMLLPSLLGSFTGAVMMIFLDKDMAQQVVRYPVKNFWIPLAGCCILVYMTSVLVGMLAGLKVRQMGYEAQERSLLDAGKLAEAAATNAMAVASPRSAKKLGSLVYGLAALLQFTLLGISVAFGYVNRYPHSWVQMLSVAEFLAAGIVFVGTAVWVGRWAGAAISKLPQRALWLPAAMMALPAIMGALAYVIGGVVYDYYYRISLNHLPMQTLVTGATQMAILIYIPAALIAVLAGFVLRMLILPRQSLLMNNE